MYSVERNHTRARVCRRSLGGKQEIGGEVGNSADFSGKEDARMFENNEQNTTLRAELGMSALKTNRDTRKLRWKYSVKNMQSKRLPAIVDRAGWKKVTKGQPVRWETEVERVW